MRVSRFYLDRPLAAGEVISHIGARPEADIAALVVAESL